MIGLDEAIQHCKEVIQENESILEEWSKHGADITKEAYFCRECIDDHRQLAEWLRELVRARILLNATYKLLEK